MESGKLFRSENGRNYLVPFILVTSLFLLWGFAHGMLDVLNKHFQDAFDMTKTRSAFVQAAVYGGYFLMALPAGVIIRRHGYRVGVCTGLLLFGIGSLLFIPGSYIGSFAFFVFSLFIIGCGLTCLETAANPYVTVLGGAGAAERRINIAQSLNGLGWILGPLVGSICVLGEDSNLVLPYTVVGIIVLIVFVIFSRIKLPEITTAEDTDTPEANGERRTRLLDYPHFFFGLVALFCYVAAQTGINSFFINYAVESADISAKTAGICLSLIGMGLFMAGRLGGSFLMILMRPERLLGWFAAGATLSMGVIMIVQGFPGFCAFFVCLLCESIMFPTIFALAIRGLGEHTKTASSLLIMTIVGGAVAPLLMGFIGDCFNIGTAFVVPLICFVIIGCYAAGYSSLQKTAKRRHGEA